MIYKTKVEGEDYALNHVTGCSHGCKYPCYAEKIALRFGLVNNHAEWLEPKLKPNYMEEIQKDIKRLKGKIKEVQLCFMCDPFPMDYPEITEATLEILKELKIANINYKILTKGILPVDKIVNIEENYFGVGEDSIRDLAISKYGISLVNTKESFREQWEPNSAQYIKRIRALNKLSYYDYKTFVYMEPFNANDLTRREFVSMLDRIRFVDEIKFGAWQYNKEKADKGRLHEYTDYLKGFCEDHGIKLLIKKEARA